MSNATPSLAQARRHTTLATRSEALPACFAEATSASYARILAKPVADRTVAQVRDARRLRNQERRIEARGGL